MKRTDIIFLLTSTLIMSIAWIVFSIIHASTSSTLSSTVIQQIEPINPVFNAKTISTISQRQVISPVYTIASDSAKVTSIPTPSVSLPPLVPVFPTQAATQGGTTR